MLAVPGVVEVHDLHVWTVGERVPVGLRARARGAGRGLPRAPPRDRRCSSTSASRSTHSTLQVEHAAPPPGLQLPWPLRASGLVRSAVRTAGPQAKLCAWRARGRPRSSPAPRAGSAPRRPRARGEAGARVAGGARRVERARDARSRSSSTSPIRPAVSEFVEQAVDGARRPRHPRQQRGPRARPRSVRGVTEEDEETVLETNVHGVMRMTRLCLPHIRDGGHIVNIGSVAGRQAVRERRGLRHVQVRRARLHPRAARGPARPADPRDDCRPGPCRDGLLARALPRRRGEGEAVYADVEPLTARGHRRVHRLRPDPAAARERRRARGQGPGAVERRVRIVRDD